MLRCQSVGIKNVASALGLAGLIASSLAGPLAAQEVKDPLPPSTRGVACTDGVDCVSPAPDSTGRIDQYGYGFVAQGTETCPANWVDLTDTGTLIEWFGDLGFDDNSATVPIAPFNFYGVDYQSLTVATNGYISTSPDDRGTNLGNNGSMCPLPDELLSGAGGRIAVLLDDLVSETAYVEYFEECPRPSDRCRAVEECTVIHWANTHHFGDTAENAFGIEAILYHRTNDIAVQYSDVPFGGINPEDGANSTTGLQDIPAVPGPPYPTSVPPSGLTYTCDWPSAMLTGDSVCFEHPAELPDSCVFSDVSIEKFSDAADRVELVEEVVYTLVVSNDGPDAARNVVVTDDLGSDVTWLSDTCDAGAPTDGVWTWEIGAMGISSLQSCDITVGIAGERGTTVENQATVALDNFDEDESNNTSNVTSFDIGYISDVSMSKASDAAVRMEPGMSVVYTLTAANAGPDETVNAVVTDDLGSLVTYVSNDCGADPPVNGVFTWNVGVIDAEADATCSITVGVSGARGTTVTNTATIGVDNIDENTENDTSNTVTFDIGYISDASISKATSAAPRVEPGTNVVYKLTVANAGPDPTVNALVTDDIGSSVAYVSNDCGAAPPAGSVFSWNVGTLAPEAQAACNVTVTVTGARGTTVTNMATVAVDNFDEVTDNNTSNTVAFDIGFLSDLTIVKADDAASSVAAGTNVVYTLTVENSQGPDPAIGVTVTDVLPEGVSYVEDDCAAGAPAGSTWSWGIGTLAVGSSATCQLTVTVTLEGFGTIINTATVGQDSIESDSADNESSTSVLVGPDSDPVFFDGFESGDLTAWTSSLGG